MLTSQERAYRAARVAEIKRVLTENEGRVELSASILQMPRTKLSRMLNHSPPLVQWWRKFKSDMQKKRARARQQRWVDRKAEREGGGREY